MALFVKFAFVANARIVANQPAFWTVNVHFPLDENLKTFCSSKLSQLVRDICDGPVVIADDFNFFPQWQGAHQYNIMSYGMDAASRNIVTNQERRVITGTYVGYPHNAYAAPDPRYPKTQLDYIFAAA